ncbi:hypothetical protein DICA0_D17678 [Diutina catenulata]
MDKLSKVVLHTFPKSRGIRVEWLLKGLKLPYTVEEYDRQSDEWEKMKQVHSLGHSPVVELVYKDGSTKVLAESGYIYEYLLEHYDPNNEFTGKTDDEKEDVRFFLFFSEGSFMPPVLPYMINDVMKWGNDHSYFTDYLPDYRNRVFEFMDEWCEKRFKAGKSWLVGDKTTAADLIMFGPCFLNEANLPQYKWLSKWYDQLKQEGRCTITLPETVM